MKHCVQSLTRLSVCLLAALVLSGILPTVLNLPGNPSTAEAASIKLSSTKIILISGQTQTIRLNGAKSKISWSSSKASVASVTSKGKVTARKKGTANITAKLGKKKYHCKVTVETPSISKKSLTLKKGGSATLKVNGTSQKIEWSTNNKKIVTVSGKGKVTAKGSGTASITAAIGNKRYSCKVTVKSPVINVQKVKLSQTRLTLNPGKKYSLTATVSPSNASNKKVTWTSSLSSVVTVSNGRITAVKKGTATITATSGGKSASCIVTVSAPIISVQAPTYSVLTASGTDNNCYGVAVILTNKGNQPIRIYSSGSRLSDYDYYKYDRNLRLYDPDILRNQNRLVYLNYVDVKPGEVKLVAWAVQGYATWYDYKSTIIFDFTYTGVMYVNKSSYYRGSTYEIK